MPQLTLNPIGSYWLTAFVAAVLVALLWVRPRHVKLSAWQFATLAGLRLAVVLLTLVAMLRPTLVYKILKPQPAALMLLLDTSRSMQVEDSLGGAARWQAARKLLVDSKDALTSLAENLDLQVLSFAGDVRPLPLVDGVPDLPTSADGKMHEIGRAPCGERV